MNFMTLLIILLCIFGASSAIVRPSGDKVTELPNVNFRMRFEHYAGYLNAGNENFYHYWFFESQANPEADPLILFLNGGPGCSSLIGLFTEVGPFRIKNSGKTVFENPYAWNKISNVLFLESPAGTGFSYSVGSWNLSDEQSVLRHYEALVSFYSKFPEFRNRTIFLTGQSYAAVYVSTLAQYIQNHWDEFPGKLAGLAIGNGVLSLPLIINSRFYYNYYHGLLGEQKWRQIINQCCRDQVEGRCNVFQFYSNSSSSCFRIVQDAVAVSEQGRDPYNIHFECYKPTAGYSDDEECGLPFGNVTRHYLDRGDVRRAAHIDVERFKTYSFDACSATVKANYTVQYSDLTSVFNSILNHERKIRVLLFNGDFDSICNFLGAQWFVDGLNRTIVNERRPIFYAGITQPNVGYQQNYDGLDYLVIRGTGHYVPADRPRESLQIISNFLRGERNYSKPANDIDTSYAQLLSAYATA